MMTMIKYRFIYKGTRYPHILTATSPETARSQACFILRQLGIVDAAFDAIMVSQYLGDNSNKEEFNVSPREGLPYVPGSQQ